MAKQTKGRGGVLKRLLTLYYGIKDPGSPWYAKLAAIAAAVYLISPIDIVPDFIPVAGYLDDIVITPLLLSLASRFIPADVRAAAAAKARVKHRMFLWIVITLAVVIVVLLVLLFRSFHHPAAQHPVTAWL